MAVAGRQLKREEDELRRKSSKRFTYSKLIVIIPDALLIVSVIAFVYIAIRIVSMEDPVFSASEVLTPFSVVICGLAVFAGIAHTAYSNKEKLSNALNQWFSFIERTVRFKQRIGQDPGELEEQLSDIIRQSESHVQDLVMCKASEAEATQENISV